MKAAGEDKVWALAKFFELTKEDQRLAVARESFADRWQPDREHGGKGRVAAERAFEVVNAAQDVGSHPAPRDSDDYSVRGHAATRKPNKIPRIVLCVRHSEWRAAEKAVKDGKFKLYRDGAISLVTLVRHLLHGEHGYHFKMPADGIVDLCIKWRAGGASIGFTVRMGPNGIEELVHENWGDATQLFAEADLIVICGQDAVACDRKTLGEYSRRTFTTTASKDAAD